MTRLAVIDNDKKTIRVMVDKHELYVFESHAGMTKSDVEFIRTHTHSDDQISPTIKLTEASWVPWSKKNYSFSEGVFMYHPFILSHDNNLPEGMNYANTF